MKTSDIPLNPGLVAIIGARGSGKTALADMIAAGCDSISDDAWKADEWTNPSFLVRARPLVGDAKVRVKWAAGDPETRALNGSDANGEYSTALGHLFHEHVASHSMTCGHPREVICEARYS
jgi:hypothetical protein